MGSFAAALEFIKFPSVELNPAPTRWPSGWNWSWPELFEGSWVRAPAWAAWAAITEAAAEWAEKEVGPEPEVGTKPEPDVGTEWDKWEDSEAVKRFLVYSFPPSEPLLPFGDKQAGFIRFSFCLLKLEKQKHWFVFLSFRLWVYGGLETTVKEIFLILED